MKLDEFIQKVNDFVSSSEISYSILAKRSQVSASVLSSIISNNYGADATPHIQRIMNYITKAQKSKELIETQNIKMTKYVVNKSISNTSMAVIYGVAGLGKTETCKSVCKGIGNGIYIECDAYITTRGLFGKITKALGITGKRSLSDTLEVIVEHLLHEDIVLFVDEAEYLSHKSLEMLRRIWDFSYTPVIFVGTQILAQNLQKHTQLYSRIQYKHEFKPLEFAECKAICEKFGSIEDSEIKYMLRLTKHSFRSTVFLIENSFDLARIAKTDTVTREIIDKAKETLLL
jgi:DNA transposition AAA+ family ATPase